MSGLISGALKGLGEGMAFVGKTNFTAKLEAEKAAAEEAKQMRLIEMQQKYAVQNRAADQEFQLGNTVLQSQLRGEQQAKEFEFRSEQTDKELKARADLTEKEIAANLKAAGIRAAGNGSEKIPTPVVLGERFNQVTQQSEKIYGIPARAEDGRVFYLDPLTGQPLSQGGSNTPQPGGGGWNVNEAVAAATSTGVQKTSPSTSANPPKEQPAQQQKKQAQPMYRDGRGAQSPSPYKDGRGA